MNNYVESLLSMVTHIMCKLILIKQIPYTIEKEINSFLNGIHHLDVKINVKNDSKYTPYWLVKYNYQSFPNLPNTMDSYEPLINLWKCSNQVEDYLRYTKHIIIDIHSVNKNLNAHTKLFSEKSIELVLSYHIDKNLIEKVHHRYSNYKD